MASLPGGGTSWRRWGHTPAPTSTPTRGLPCERRPRGGTRSCCSATPGGGSSPSGVPGRPSLPADAGRRCLRRSPACSSCCSERARRALACPKARFRRGNRGHSRSVLRAQRRVDQGRPGRSSKLVISWRFGCGGRKSPSARGSRPPFMQYATLVALVACLAAASTSNSFVSEAHATLGAEPIQSRRRRRDTRRGPTCVTPNRGWNPIP
jgi:hypothetical protein